ncbi:MAG: cupredoxin domain-containing protein [Tepidiformaceae bacterium]
MRIRLAIVPFLLLSLLLLVTAACGDDDDDDGANDTPAAGGSPSGEDAAVAVADNKFEPGEVTVGVNHEVIWTWEGNNSHSVVGTFDGEDVESPRLSGSGGTFVFSFDKAGTFEYQCGVHGASMSGKVTIE